MAGAVSSLPLRRLVLFPNGDPPSSAASTRLMTIYDEERRSATDYLHYHPEHHLGTYSGQEEINASRTDVVAHAFDRQLPGLVPLYRYRKTSDPVDYFYTTNKAEGDKAISTY